MRVKRKSVVIERKKERTKAEESIPRITWDRKLESVEGKSKGSNSQTPKCNQIVRYKLVRKTKKELRKVWRRGDGLSE